MRRREFPLTLDEQDRIDQLEQDDHSVLEIARRLSRPRRSILYHLHHSESHCEEESGDEMRQLAFEVT